MSENVANQEMCLLGENLTTRNKARLTSVYILSTAWGIGKGTELSYLWRYIRIGVDGLPNGEKAIHISGSRFSLQRFCLLCKERRTYA